MARNPTAMTVVAAAISDGQGRWLLQKRPPEKRHGGLWEFPGGKVEADETPLQALVREVNEELTISVTVAGGGPVAQAIGEAGGGEPRIVISLYTIAGWEGVPIAEPGAELAWFTALEIGRLPLPPLDAELAMQLFAAAG